MHRRVLVPLVVWLLSLALAVAPVASAWAMTAPAAHATHAAHMPAYPSAPAKQPQPLSPASSDRIATAHDHAGQVADAQRRAVHTDEVPNIDATAVLAAAPAGIDDAAMHYPRAGSSDCGDDRCDGACCGFCILTLGALTAPPATNAFAGGDSPAYRRHPYTSFIPTLIGRPPQS